MTDRKNVRLDLSDEQKPKVKPVTAQEPNTELKLDELEERIAPVRF
jgi:hypothetical protein